MNRTYWLWVCKHTGKIAFTESHWLRLLEQEKITVKRTRNVASEHKGSQLWVELVRSNQKQKYSWRARRNSKYNCRPINLTSTACKIVK